MSRMHAKTFWTKPNGSPEMPSSQLKSETQVLVVCVMSHVREVMFIVCCATDSDDMHGEQLAAWLVLMIDV